MCCISHVVCYWHMQSSGIHNSPMVGMPFVLVELTRLIVNELNHWVTWSHKTGINFPFLRGKIIYYFRASPSPHHFSLIYTCGVTYIWKVRIFCLLLKDFLRKLRVKQLPYIAYARMPSFNDVHMILGMHTLTHTLIFSLCSTKKD